MGKRIYKETENSTHYILHCPVCGDINGGSTPKYYLDKKKGLGHCFRCGYSSLDPDLALEYELTKEDKEEFIVHNYMLNLIPELTEQGKEYLLKRGLTEEIIDLYKFKSYHIWGKDTVFIPNKVENDKTDFYQLRFIDGGNFRYYTAKATKPLFGLAGLSGSDSVILCEGIFTSIGAKMKLGIDSVCLLGKTLTAYQQMQIVELLRGHSELVVGLDSQTYSESYSLARRLLNLFPEKKISIILLPDDELDYADMDKERAMKYYNDRIILNSVSHIGDIKLVRGLFK